MVSWGNGEERALGRVEAAVLEQVGEEVAAGNAVWINCADEHTAARRASISWNGQ